MMKKIVVLMLVGILLMTGTVFAATTLEKIKKVGKLKIAVDPTYPPFTYFDEQEKKYVGFDVDMMNMIADELGVEAEIMPVAWDGVIPGLLSKQYDMIMSAMTITEERAKKVHFSQPYYVAGQIIIVNEGETEIAGPEDLKGRKVGVQLGTTGEIALQEMNIEGIDIVKYDLLDLAVVALRNKNVIAVVADAPTMAAYVKQKGDIKMVGDIFTTEEYGIAMRQEDKDFHEAVDAALSNILNSPVFQELKDKWTGGK